MNIQPTNSVNFPLDAEANQLGITVNNFGLFPSQISITWEIYGNGASKSGVIILPQSIVDVWGTDDAIVKEYVLEQLGLTEII